MGLYPLNGGNQPNKEPLALALHEGMQIVDVEEATPITVDNLQGRTFLNLLGRAGSCELDSNGDGIPDGWYLNSGLIAEAKVVDGGYTGKGFSAKSKHASDFRISGFEFTDYSAYKYLLVVAMVKTIAGGSRLQFVGRSKDGTGEILLAESNLATNLNQYAPVFAVADVREFPMIRLDWRANGQWNGGVIDDVRLYPITESEYAAVRNMTPEHVVDRYMYIDSISNVTNPYIEATGENLLPPFTKWGNVGDYRCVISPHELSFKNAPRKDEVNMYMPALEGQTYTLSAQHTGFIGVNAWDASGKGIGIVSVVPYTKAQSVTFKTPTGAVRISIHFANVSGDGSNDYIPNCIFKNPMLVIGSESKPFQPRKRSLWAAEAQLAAHPVTGADADVLYTGDDGLPYILEKWRKVILDQTLPWTLDDTEKLNFKSVRLTKRFTDSVSSNKGYDVGRHSCVKYDGSAVKLTDWQTQQGAPDIAWLGEDGSFHISISNTDSGWGMKYKPTADEIKAYFLGWKMYDTQTSQTMLPYDRIDGQYKGWVRRNDGGSFVDGTGNLPTSRAPITAAWSPYQLQYIKKTPTAVPVETYETGATFSVGTNVVKVGSGIVIRERSLVYGDVGYGHQINRVGVNPLTHKVSQFCGVFRGRATDSNWRYLYDLANGNQRAVIDWEDYDPYAVYYVTYTMLVRTLAAKINVKSAANLRGTVTTLVDQVGDVDTRLSVIERQKVDEISAPWVVPTLLNGWTSNIAHLKSVSYAKDGDQVRLAGTVSGGSVGNIFRLPEGYRPNGNVSFAVYSLGQSGREPAFVTVGIAGDVYFLQGANREVSLDGIEFRAEK